MSVPHWGSLPPNVTDGSAFGREGSGSWEAETPPPDGPNAPVSVYTTRPAEPKGFQFDNVTFREVCGWSSIAAPYELTNNSASLSAAVVINITAITNTSPNHSIAVQIESCDGTNSHNATTPGVFVVPGTAAAVFIERWHESSGSETAGDCPGQSFIALSSATLTDYCKVDTSLAECKTVAPNAPSSLSSQKTHCRAVAMIGLLASVVAILA